MTLTIRPFRPEDQSAVRALALAGLAEHFAQPDAAMNPDLDDIWGAYPARGHCFLVAEAEGAIVASGALLVNGDAGQLARVSVAPGWRRRGVARAIVKRLLGEARRAGLARAWMETNDDWDPAIRLYMACGFTPFDHRDGCTFMGIDL
jgi:ribosomal protein S18 acetylase RimI-like enzyme